MVMLWALFSVLTTVDLLYRNIPEVLSCFSDSPPPSPTFPEGGNPVLYGEEDNKVTTRMDLRSYISRIVYSVYHVLDTHRLVIHLYDYTIP